MPVPAAASAVPLAVLVLAWDEAAPAVRALLDATQPHAPAPDSILAMVPQPDAPGHLSAEEYLPLELPATDEPAAPAALPATPPPAAATAEALAPSTISLTVIQAEALEADCEPALDEVLLPTLAAPPVWAAVRVLRLGGASLAQLAQRAGQPLPAPTWTGAASAPAAPYLGSTTAPPGSLDTDVENKILAVELANFELLQKSVPAAQPLPGPPAATAAAITPGPPAASPPQYQPAEPAAQATDLEADLLPNVADELADFETSAPDLRGGYSMASNPPTAAHADWPAALATLRKPAPAPGPTLSLPGSPAAADHSKTSAPQSPLHPAAPYYPAPNLNFQVIQYARFAVPVALAEADFAAIYAPAWPTWLAAQELRQRTGRPLVLHVAALAAPEGESADTAAGWMADLQRQALRRADLVLAETPALALRLRHELGLSQVQVVPAADAAAVAQALHEARPRPAGAPAGL